MQIIGICGGIGSGKSTVSNVFSKHSIPVLDTDEIYHALTSAPSACLDELVRHFGAQILSNGALDRSRLSTLIFSSSDPLPILNELNAITHKHVIREVDVRIADLESDGYDVVAVQVPLLFESGFDKRCDVIVAVVADREVRIERIISRDSISRERAISKIEAQMPDEFLIAHANYVINNDLGLDNIELQVDNILKEII